MLYLSISSFSNLIDKYESSAMMVSVINRQVRELCAMYYVHYDVTARMPGRVLASSAIITT